MKASIDSIKTLGLSPSPVCSVQVPAVHIAAPPAIASTGNEGYQNQEGLNSVHLYHPPRRHCITNERVFDRLQGAPRQSCGIGSIFAQPFVADYRELKDRHLLHEADERARELCPHLLLAGGRQSGRRDG